MSVEDYGSPAEAFKDKPVEYGGTIVSRSVMFGDAMRKAPLRSGWPVTLVIDQYLKRVQKIKF